MNTEPTWKQETIGAITPYERNAKKHPKQQIDKIAASIREFGFNQPIVADPQGVIIVGHGRYEAAKQLGLDTIPVVRVALDEERAKAYRLADNKLAESGWDTALVLEELKALSFPMLDLTGFSHDLVLDRNVADENVPEVPKAARTQPGDLYELGRHRLLCGDSTKREDVAQLMEGKRADMCFTDPPYALFGNSSGVAGVADDKMIRSFFRDVLTAIRENVKLFGHGYVCSDWRSFPVWYYMSIEVGLASKNCIVWDKGDGGLGSMYQLCHEFVLFFTNDPLHSKTNGKEAGQRIVTGKSNIWRFPRTTGAERQHNAAKPVNMLVEAVNNSSENGAIILDLFLGSGSTMIAAERTGRACYGMEIDPAYCDVSVKRWLQHTGTTSVRKNGVVEEWPVS